MPPRSKDPVTPSVPVLKRLFAVARNRCAFPDCTSPIVDPSGEIVGEVCHIAGRLNGPRYDPGQSNLERHGFDNLVVLCGTHHKIVDQQVEEYTVPDLLALKHKHEHAHATHLEMSVSDVAINRLFEMLSAQLVAAQNGSLLLQSNDRLYAEARQYQQNASRQYRGLPIDLLSFSARSQARTVDLTEIFVPPSAVIAMPSDDFGKSSQEVGPITNLLDDPRHPWLLVLGGPGSGKSSLTRWICLREDPGGSFAFNVELAEFWNEHREHGFLAYLASLARRFGSELVLADIKRLADAGKILWCFDGLDEVAIVKARREILAMIRALRQQFPRCLGLVTCRIAAAHGLDVNDFTVCTLQPFGQTEVRRFLDRWDRAAERVTGTRSHLRARIERSRLSSHTVREWTQTPLLLTALVLLNDDAELPTRTHSLYERLLSRLINRWEEGKESPIERLTAEVKLAFLRELAWEMANRGTAAVLDNRVSEQTVRIVLERCLRTQGVGRSGGEGSRVDDLLLALRSRDTALAWTGGADYCFVHRSLFEFMVATAFLDPALARADWTSQRFYQLYAERWAEPTWRNVLTLLPGFLGEAEAISALQGAWSSLRPLTPIRIQVLLSFTLDCIADRHAPIASTGAFYRALMRLHEVMLTYDNTPMVVAALSRRASRAISPISEDSFRHALNHAEATEDAERFLEVAFATVSLSNRQTLLERMLPRAGRAFLSRWSRHLEALGPWTTTEAALLLRHIEGPPHRPDAAVTLASSLPAARDTLLRIVPALDADACRLALHFLSEDDTDLLSAIFGRMRTLAPTHEALEAWGQAHFMRWRRQPLVTEILEALHLPLEAAPVETWTNNHRMWASFLLDEFRRPSLLRRWREDLTRRLQLPPAGEVPSIVPSMIELSNRWPLVGQECLAIFDACAASPIPARNAIGLAAAAHQFISFDTFLAGIQPTNYTLVEDFANYIDGYAPASVEDFHVMSMKIGEHFALDADGCSRLLVRSICCLTNSGHTGWIAGERLRFLSQTTDLTALLALDPTLSERPTHDALHALRRDSLVRYCRSLHHLHPPPDARWIDPTLIAELIADGSSEAIQEATRLAIRLGERSVLRRLLDEPAAARICKDLTQFESSVVAQLLAHVDAILDINSV